MVFEDEETPPEETTEEVTEETAGGQEAEAAAPKTDMVTEDGEGALPDGQERDLEAVYDIPVKVAAVLGHASMPVNQLLKLGRGAVVELDRRVGEAIDIYVNNLLVARGEVVIVDDKLGVTMTEIIKSQN